jgi:membrane associated rhomboid family serine protease
MPAATGFLLIVNILGYLLQQIYDPGMTEAFGLWIDPDDLLGHVLEAPWQLVTYSFLHGGELHLGFNLLALWMFGSDVERVWGPKRFLAAYFAAVLTGAVMQIIAVALGSGAGLAVIGASGGVFGILLCFGMLFPKRRVMLLIPPIPMQARTLVIVFAVLSLLFGLTGAFGGIAHFAHLGGLIGGWLVYRYGAALSANT